MSNSLEDVNQALEEQESSLEADRLVTDGGRRDDEEDRRRRRGPPPWWYEDMWRRFPPWWYEWRETGEEGKPGDREITGPRGYSRREDDREREFRRPPGPWDYEGREEDIDVEIPGEMSRELRELRDEHLEVLDDLRVKHRDLKEAHLAELDNLFSRYQSILDENDLAEELEEDYEKILDEHISLLEDLAEEENRGLLTRAGIGLGTLALGYITAEIYLPDESVLDFYAQAPEIYSGSPAVGIVTAGLPAVGIYALGRAYQKQKRYSEIKDELSEYRSMKEDL